MNEKKGPFDRKFDSKFKLIQNCQLSEKVINNFFGNEIDEINN